MDLSFLAEIPSSCLKLMLIEKNSQIDFLKSTLLMFPFTILKSGQEWVSPDFFTSLSPTLGCQVVRRYGSPESDSGDSGKT